MCGISVIISKGKKIPDNSINIMNGKAIHRGPDASGIFKSDKINLGFNRLSIIDLSPKGHQPMKYLDKYVIVFNGEIFNYKELKQDLKVKGYLFNSSSDTEVIMASYDYYGIDFVEKLNGMWSFCIYDFFNDEIIISRDRFGIKPLYYFESEDFIYYSSEIKQILDFTDRSVNKNIVYDYLFMLKINHTDNTFFNEIKKVSNSTVIKFDKNLNCIKKKYYDIEKKENNLSFSNSLEKFDYLIKDSVKLRLRSDVKVGTLFSGGVDSTIITKVSNDLLNNNSISAFHFHSKKFSEKKYVDEFSKNENLNVYHINEAHDDKTLNDLILCQEEPFGSMSIYAQNQIFNFANKKKYKVLLSGQGGDEVFYGYDRYQLLRQFSLKKLYFYNKYFNLLGNIYRFKHSNFSIIRTLYKNNNLNHFSNFFDFQRNEILKYQLPVLLNYEDKNSMSQSVESRLPFLDYRIVNFGVNLPVNYKIRENGKFLLREYLRLNKIDTIANRTDKIGFDYDFNVLFNEKRNKYIKEVKDSYYFKSLFGNSFNKILKENDWVLWRFYNLKRFMELFNLNEIK